MIRANPLLRLAGVASLAVALSGCVSLLPKTKPAHLYSFGQPTGSTATDAPMGQVGVFRTNATFQREAAGDRLLTLTNGKAAYVADTRWVAPAAVLWDQAVVAAFEADPGPVRLMSRGEPGSAAYVLRLDVRNFETHYDRGAKGAPEVVVRARALLAPSKGGGAEAVEKVFETRVRAGDNRVSAIVPAYDKAVSQILGEIVAWTNAQARPA